MGQAKAIAFTLAAFAAALLVPVQAYAGSPEDDYFAARNAIVAAIKANETNHKADDNPPLDEKGRADLTRRMQAIVGPVVIKGMSGEPKINLDTLYEGDQGFGLLDGLLYTSADDKTRVVVAPETVYRRWVVEHKDWWGDKIANVPQGTDDIFTANAFYTQATSTDAAVYKYVALSVTKPDGARVAVAILAGRSQDLAPNAPDELFVSVVKDGKVFILNAPLAKKIAPIPACDAIKRDYEKKAEDAFSKANERNREKGSAATDADANRADEDFSAIQNEGDDKFLACFEARGRKAGLFTEPARQAQALIGLLPEK